MVECVGQYYKTVGDGNTSPVHFCKGHAFTPDSFFVGSSYLRKPLRKNRGGRLLTLGHDSCIVSHRKRVVIAHVPARKNRRPEMGRRMRLCAHFICDPRSPVPPMFSHLRKELVRYEFPPDAELLAFKDQPLDLRS